MNNRYKMILEKFKTTSKRQSTTKVKSQTGKLYKKQSRKDEIIINPEDKSHGSLYVSG